MQSPTILLHSGEYLNLLDPQSSKFSIEDIAHGLSMTCRFNGQCDAFYSVAEHCVVMSEMVQKDYKLEALMHDASEAFLGDIVTPLKKILPAYQVIEKSFERQIALRYGLPMKMSPQVKKADTRMCVTEQQQLMNNKDVWRDDMKDVLPYDIELSCWSWPVAKQMFLMTYERLKK
jgi:hypothetical protein